MTVVKGHGLTLDCNRELLADLLIRVWGRGKTCSNNHHSDFSTHSCHFGGVMPKWLASSTALVAENQKLQSNSPKCQELGWAGVAQDTFSGLASHLDTSQFRPNASVGAEICAGLTSIWLGQLPEPCMHVGKRKSCLPHDYVASRMDSSCISAHFLCLQFQIIIK